MQLKKIDDYRWEIPKTGDMNVPGLIFTSEKFIDKVIKEKAVDQVRNVATLPGIVGKSLAMPDIHWGYGFPIGGVAAFDIDKGVISPGGIGYDINCGVRLLRTNLKAKDIKHRIKDLVFALYLSVPSGVGSTGTINLSKSEVKNVSEKGASWAVERNYGSKEDLNYTEENGSLKYADSSTLSARAVERGAKQLGTLGAGNHFMEIQEVSDIYDEKASFAFGLEKGNIAIMIHTGSRGFGYQVCDDYIKILNSAVKKYQIKLPDRQLVCAPVKSQEGKEYYSAMSCAANYAWANRQVITHRVREAFMKTLSMTPKDLGLELVYDVAHNIGKFESYNNRTLFVHRKGATRSFPKGHADIPDSYKEVGQPVLIPGTMGTESYVALGTENAMNESFGSNCHGAGRVMSRSQAVKITSGQELQRKLEEKGIIVKAESYKTLAEETPEAYKDVGSVVDISEKAGLSKKVARLKPLGVVKG